MSKITNKNYWSVIRVQQCDIEKPGDKKGWYCRIIRTNGTLPSDILCDGEESTLNQLCQHLNNLTPRMIDIVMASENH